MLFRYYAVLNYRGVKFHFYINLSPSPPFHFHCIRFHFYMSLTGTRSPLLGVWVNFTNPTLLFNASLLGTWDHAFVIGHYGCFLKIVELFSGNQASVVPKFCKILWTCGEYKSWKWFWFEMTNLPCVTKGIPIHFWNFKNMLQTICCTKDVGKNKFLSYQSNKKSHRSFFFRSFSNQDCSVKNLTVSSSN